MSISAWREPAAEAASCACTFFPGSWRLLVFASVNVGMMIVVWAQQLHPTITLHADADTHDEGPVVDAFVQMARIVCAESSRAMAVDMYGRMTCAAAWVMTAHWDWLHIGLLFSMWSAMMVAMM